MIVDAATGELLMKASTNLPNEPIADNNSVEQWEAEGALDTTQRANALWKRRLAEYEAPALDSAIDEELLEFVARRKAELPDEFA